MTAAPASGTPGARREATRAVLLPRGHGHHRRGADALHAGIGAAGVAATAVLAAEQGLSGFERDVFEAVNGLPQTATPGLWVVMQAGSLAAVFVTAGLALAARRPRLALALAAGGTTTWLLAKVVKQLVERGRPEALLHDVVVYGPAATGLGFPSGHAAVAAAIMTVAGPYLTGRARVAGWVASEWSRSRACSSAPTSPWTRWAGCSWAGRSAARRTWCWGGRAPRSRTEATGARGQRSTMNPAASQASRMARMSS